MTPHVCVGIDVAEPRKGLDLVALDPARTVVASHGRLTPDAALAVVHGLRPAVVCIDSPPGWSSGGRSRLAERALASAGIHAFATGPDPGDNPFYRWMRVGAQLFAALGADYPRYRGGPVAGTAAEVFPHSIAVILAGRLHGERETKSAFRRAVLTTHGVDAACLPSLDRVDAALAALAGVRAMEGAHSWVGDPDEGVILLPAALPAMRLRRPQAAEADGGETLKAALRVSVRTARPLAARAPASRQPVLPLFAWADAPPAAAVATGRWCQCGCGAAVRARFLPGHDAKLKSRLLGERAAGSAAALASLVELGWWRQPTA